MHVPGVQHCDQCLMRFRLSTYTLRVVLGRWSSLPHAERLCQYSAQCQVEDEYHLLFECDAYNSVRLWFKQLFDICSGVDDVGRVDNAAVQTGSVRLFMAQHPRRVAAFIHECFAWRAQADPLPPYFPADHMLDTFSSSESAVEADTVGEDVTSYLSP